MSDPDWSVGEAFKVFLSTSWGDFGGYETARHKFLRAHSWIGQQKCTLEDRSASYLLSAQARKIPPVIFLHGSPGNAMDWRWFLANEGKRFAVYAMDRPGFGPVDRKVPHLRDDLAVLRRALSLIAQKRGPVILVGHSLGGGVAARLAADCAEQVRGLVLVGASLNPQLERVFPIQKQALQPPLSQLLTVSVRNSNAELVQYPDFLAELELYLGDIKCRITAIHSKDDLLVPYDNVAFVRERCKGAAAFDVLAPDSGGHFLNRRRPDLIMKALETYL